MRNVEVHRKLPPQVTSSMNENSNSPNVPEGALAHVLVVGVEKIRHFYRLITCEGCDERDDTNW